MYLYHYYDKSVGPFRNLSDVSVEEAKAIMQNIKETKPVNIVLKQKPPLYSKLILSTTEVLY